jgi:hypothetical protein
MSVVATHNLRKLRGMIYQQGAMAQYGELPIVVALELFLYL